MWCLTFNREKYTIKKKFKCICFNFRKIYPQKQKINAFSRELWFYFSRNCRNKTEVNFLKGHLETEFSLSELVRSTFYDGIKPVSKYSLCSQTRHQMKAYSLMISDFAAMYCLLVPVYPRIGQSLTDFRSLRKMGNGHARFSTIGLVRVLISSNIFQD